MTSVPISEAKGRLSELVRESESVDVVLLRHGEPAAVIVSVARYDQLLHEFEELLDRLSRDEVDSRRAG